MLGKMLKLVERQLPGVKALVHERDALNTKVSNLAKTLSVWKKGFVPPGHYYSPIPDIEQTKSRHAQIFEKPINEISGIDLNTSEQLKLLEAFTGNYGDMPFPEDPSSGFRYHLNNDFYAYSDGICLYSMLRHLKPRRFIEVGSGFSSAAALDTRDRFLDREMEFIFIEPYPERLESLLTSDDKKNENLKIIRSFVQDVTLDIFSSLQSGDILFIDSTHVSRVGSDVNHLFFEVIPALNPGVYIHIHDIFFPFEYPEKWIYDGRAWNESYLLRAFLQYNRDFEIVFFNSYLQQAYPELIAEKMPLCLKKPNGELTIPGSIWLHKLR